MKRKTFILLIFILGLSLQAVFAQKTDTEKEVSKIRSGVLRTSKLLTTFKKSTQFVDGVSLEGTEATFYKSPVGLKKIQAEIGGETYYANVDYYYSDSGKLIFVYHQFNRYDTQIGMDPPPRVVRKEERRLYLKDGKIIKKITTITETAESYPSEVTEKTILELEQTFRKAQKK